jgi:hypothetical protein
MKTLSKPTQRNVVLLAERDMKKKLFTNVGMRSLTTALIGLLWTVMPLRADTVVYPTGSYPADVQAVQAAVDGGGGGGGCVPQPVTGAKAQLAGTLQLSGAGATIIGFLVGKESSLGMWGASLRLPNPECKGAYIDVPLKYSWTITARPPGSTASLTQANTLSPRLVPDRPGAWTVTFTACPSGCSVVVADVTIPPLKRVLSFTAITNFPSPFVIDGSTPNPVQALIFALTESPNEVQVVELCNVDLDLTGHSHIDIGAKRSLIASPFCARGPRSLGPRIFVTDPRDEHTPLFAILDSDVRFSGFRLEGPTSGIGSGDNRLEDGIWILPSFPGLIHNIEISNMEISNWSGAGVKVTDSDDKKTLGHLTNANVSAVRIKNNFFHHNRHDSGNGYGVSVTAGAYALIEQNVFDENRHAIAGISSTWYPGYTARDNLILSGGGYHCSDSWYWALTGWTNLRCYHTHQIDMHGDGNSWYSASNWQCGTAGETIIIERNTILYDAGDAIKIRGNPADKAVVDDNVFKHKKDGAISQNGACGFGDNITKPIDVRPNNVFGVDPSTELGSCDFFGDGNKDQFMATGVTWWALSPITQQWRYLNTMKERLPQLELAKFDGDPVCDVAPRRARPEMLPRIYSKSGTGPWVPFLANPPAH